MQSVAVAADARCKLKRSLPEKKRRDDGAAYRPDLRATHRLASSAQAQGTHGHRGWSSSRSQRSHCVEESVGGKTKSPSATSAPLTFQLQKHLHLRTQDGLVALSATSHVSLSLFLSLSHVSQSGQAVLLLSFACIVWHPFLNDDEDSKIIACVPVYSSIDHRSSWDHQAKAKHQEAASDDRCFSAEVRLKARE